MPSWGRENDADLDRRRLLQSVGASVVAAGMGGLAGCSTLLSGGGLGATADGLGKLAYEPGVIDDVDQYGVEYLDIEAVLEAEDDLPADLLDSFEDRHETLHDVTGVGFDDATARFSFRTTTVFWAEHDVNDVADELEENGFDDEDEYGNYTPFVHDDEAIVVAIDGNRIVKTKPTSSEDDPEDVFETVYETIEGEADRYVDGSDAFAQLLDALDGADAFRGAPHETTDETNAESGRFEDETARGVRATFQPDEAIVTVDVVLVFEDEDAVDTDDVTTWTETGAFDDYADASVSANGAVVTVETTVDVADYSLDVPRARPSGYEYVPEPSAIDQPRNMDITIGQPNRVLNAEASSTELLDGLVRRASGVLNTMTGVEMDTFETVTSYPSASIGVGGFERNQLDLSAAGSGEGPVDRYSGFDLFPTSNGAVAVSDRVVVAAPNYSSSDAAMDTLRTVLDAGTGDGRRFVDADDDFGLLADKLGTTDVVLGSTQTRIERTDTFRGEFEGSVASGFSLTLDGSQVTFASVDVYDTAESIDMTAVDQFLQIRSEMGEGFVGWSDDVEVSRDGRTVTISGTFSTDNM